MKRLSRADFQPFYEDSPRDWFSAFEKTCTMHKVTEDQKLTLLLNIVPFRYHPFFNEDTTYESFKKTVISRSCPSPSESLKQLTRPPADLKPTELLIHMRKHAANANFKDDAALRQYFLNALPHQVRVPLLPTAITMSLEELARLADRMLEQTPKNITAIDQQNSMASFQQQQQLMQQQITMLTDTVRQLTQALQDRPRQRSPTYSSRRSPSPAPRAQKMCYAHRKFGANAYSCQPPCEFPGNGRYGH